MDTDLNIHIDLNNLEDGKFENSKYVLTSPRSLEACSKLNVKPIELLYKPLAEFQEELLPQDIPLQTIYNLYDEREHIRLKKLQLCREERGRIIKEENQKKSKYFSKALKSTHPLDDFLSRYAASTPDRKSTSTYARKEKKSSFDKESTKLHRELVSKKDKSPQTSHVSIRARPHSSDKRKSQRCSPSVTLGVKVRYRSGSAPSGVHLPARDEKILKLMKDRRESEQKSLSVINDAHRLWEDQKKREDILRIMAENKRRQLLAEETRIKETRKTRDDERREKEEEEERQMRALLSHETQSYRELVLMNQLRLKEMELADKIRKQNLLKEVKAQNRKAEEGDDEEMAELLLAKQLSDIGSASEKKDVRIHQESLKKFLDNRKEREQFEQRKRQLKNQEKQNEELVKSSMEVRLSQAEANLSQVLEQRNRQLEEHHRQEQAKLQRARSSHKKLEAETKAWGLSLLDQKKLMETRAQKAVTRSIELKSLLARKQRIEKELEHHKNLTKIQKEEKRRLRDLERSLLEKERKVDDLLEEKERTVSETRALAQLSQTLRDDIKEKYQSDTFDKKVLEAQLYANLESRIRSRSPGIRKK
ncbi:unnamed protein product [Lymnaea stagnalis]|uniref:Uncharacterized protein n=1 Tax=Lymnaea stagnalis TaxID=6523 RepID=A0AAV2GYM2_LYMST